MVPPHTDLNAWESARMVQIAWQLHDELGNLVEVKNYIIKPDDFDIPYNSEQIHGISTERALKQGVDVKFALEKFNKAVERSSFNVGHNIGFDMGVVGSEFVRTGIVTLMHELGVVDTMKSSVEFCALPGGKGGKFKFPKLEELHHKLFEEGFDAAHNASADVEATSRCFLELLRKEVIPANIVGWNIETSSAFKLNNPNRIKAIGLNIEPYTPLEEEIVDNGIQGDVIDEYGSSVEKVSKSKGNFFHIHNHTQFSILQSMSGVNDLVAKAKELNMPAVAISDHGNLFAAFNFVNACEKNDILGIVGVELNVCKDHEDKTVKDNGYGTVFLAKNERGYKNLVKLASRAYTHGFYYVPRVDRNLVEQYKEDLVVISGGIFSELPSLILNIGERQASESCQWWKKNIWR